VLSPEIESEALEAFEHTPFEAFVLHGQPARRMVKSYGWSYNFGDRGLRRADPLPPYLVRLRLLAAGVTDVPAVAFEQALVTRYPPGATIGWHRDVPSFGPVVVGVSLRSPCRMRLRRVVGGVRYLHEQTLEPRSVYVLSRLARSAWEHSIPPTEDLRFSVTFRTLRDPGAPVG
jgi:alkylated DNA repair dioxygenase AlkB